MTDRPILRSAELADLDALLSLEQTFPGDRLGRASFRHLLSRGNADVILAEGGGRVLGDAVVLYRRGFHSARLYSLAVAEAARGRGVGRMLLSEAEERARARGCVSLRLEVREDNAAALRLYERAGFEVVGRTAEYYEDGSAALRLRKRLVAEGATLHSVPYYAQTLPFTCGPATLMMAMRALGWQEPFSRGLELQLWREATTVFMLSGHGGCSAEGLAVAALRRGFAAEVWTRDASVPFTESVRLAYKKDVIRLAHEQFTRELEALGGVLRYRSFTHRDVSRALEAGALPLILVSTYRMDGKKEPHWVVASGHDGEHLYLHDPYVPKGLERADGVHLPLKRRDFAQVSRFGKAGHRYLLLLRRAEKERRAEPRAISYSEVQNHRGC
jgi:ribosomal protein S18 acetylase RimI-like enzyme